MKSHPPPTDIHMRLENMTYYRGPHFQKPTMESDTACTALHVQVLLTEIVTSSGCGPTHLSNVLIHVGHMESSAPVISSAHALLNSKFVVHSSSASNSNVEPLFLSLCQQQTHGQSVRISGSPSTNLSSHSALVKMMPTSTRMRLVEWPSPPQSLPKTLCPLVLSSNTISIFISITMALMGEYWPAHWSFLGEGFCPPFESRPNQNLFQHCFGLKFHLVYLV